MTGQHRTLKDIKEGRTPADIWEMVEGIDPCTRALISLELVADCRVSEALGLGRSQIVYDYEPGFAAIKNFACNKPRKDHAKLSYRDLVYLPKEGVLAPFTDTFLSYVSSLPDSQEMVFPFCRQTAYNHVREATGLWNHFFRSMAHDYWVRVFKNSTMTAGIYLNVDERSLKPYLHVDMDDYKGRILS